jgi:N-acyl-D-aspartate/D-glutamate deacylase
MFHGAYTWAAWFWRALVREWRLLKPEEAVHRLTGMPAKILGLSDRGAIRVGARADIAVFSEEKFGERGTMFEPNQLAHGMHHVVVNGVATLSNGALTGARAGQVLRKR